MSWLHVQLSMHTTLEEHLAVSLPSDLVKEPMPAKQGGSLARVHTSNDRAYTSKVGVTYFHQEGNRNKTRQIFIYIKS